MTKSELVEKVAAESDISLSAADRVVSEVFANMTDTLVAGGGVEIRGFGSFTVREYEGHNGRNPKTGGEVVVSPKKRPFFKCGKELKERILNGSGN